MARSVNGTVMPSARAVLRLMISSTLVACCTGKSAGLSPLKDTAGIEASNTRHLPAVGSIAHQAAVYSPRSARSNGRQGVALRQRDKLRAQTVSERTGAEHQRARAQFRQSRGNQIDIAFEKYMGLQAKSAGGQLVVNCVNRVTARRFGRVEKSNNRRDCRHRLVQHLHPFPLQLLGQDGHACKVASRTVQPIDETCPNWVHANRERNWSRRRGRLCRQGCREAVSHNYTHLPSNKVLRQCGKLVKLKTCP